MLDILDNYQPITLEEMSGIRLMNRTDTKFVTTTDQLRKLLKLAVWQYRVQEIDATIHSTSTRQTTTCSAAIMQDIPTDRNSG